MSAAEPDEPDEQVEPDEPEPSSLAEAQRDLARERIVLAARRSLAERGLATTVDDVADLAGVSRRTVFRHFGTREALFAAAIEGGLRAYGQHLPAAEPEDGDLDGWLRDVLVASHRSNARNGRIYWELSTMDPELSGELAAAAALRREARRGFADRITKAAWKAAGGRGRVPPWLVDAFAVHLSGFTTRSLEVDFDRTPDEVAAVSVRVLRAALAAAVAERSR